MRALIVCLLAAAATGWLTPAKAQVVAENGGGQSTAVTGFEAYKNYLAHRARIAGVREDTIRAHIPSLRLSERAIQLDRAQRPAPSSGSGGGDLSLSPYLRQHVTPSLISRGQSRYYHQWPHLVRIHAKYGVDPAVLIAIYGKETSYGGFTGNFDLLDVLASLAYEGRDRCIETQGHVDGRPYTAWLSAGKPQAAGRGKKPRQSGCFSTDMS